MKILYSTLIIVSTLFAQSKEFVIDKSYSFVEYEGSHFLHNWVGKSYSINGSILIDTQLPSNSSVEVSIPIFSFDSNNGNRDSNMLLFVEEHIFPEVKFHSDSVTQINETEFEVIGDLDFHGILKDIMLPVVININSDYTYINSTFTINLNEFDVDRPKLMLTPINEEIEIRINLRGNLKD